MFAFSKTLPALPAPDVATEICPLSEMLKVGTGANPGAVTVICPAFPVLDAVLNNPLSGTGDRRQVRRPVTVKSPRLPRTQYACYRP